MVFYTILSAFSSAILFAYIGSSPFIFQDHYGVSPMTFSVIFASNAVAMMMGNFFSIQFKNLHKTLTCSVTGLFCFALATGTALLFHVPLYLFCIPLFIMLFFTGAIFPIVTNLVLEMEQKYRGTASAILGASGFLAGGLVMPLAGLGNILSSTACVFMACALMAVVMLYLLRHRNIPHSKYLSAKRDRRPYL